MAKLSNARSACRTTGTRATAWQRDEQSGCCTAATRRPDPATVRLHSSSFARRSFFSRRASPIPAREPSPSAPRPRRPDFRGFRARPREPVTMLGARSRMTSLMMFLVCSAGFLPVATAYTYTFIMSVVSVSEGQNGLGPHIRDIRLDGVRPTEDQFNINKMPDRDLCQAHNGATCDAGQIGMIDDDPNTDSNWWATRWSWPGVFLYNVADEGLHNRDLASKCVLHARMDHRGGRCRDVSRCRESRK